VELKELPPQSDDPEIIMQRLKGLMERTQMSQKQLQRWDKQNGLPKSHSQTMVNSGRSRKQLQNGVILKKWNGDPLITQKEKLKAAAAAESAASSLEAAAAETTTSSLEAAAETKTSSLEQSEKPASIQEQPVSVDSTPGQSDGKHRESGVTEDYKADELGDTQYKNDGGAAAQNDESAGTGSQSRRSTDSPEFIVDEAMLSPASLDMSDD
jgi:hypothetical protein